MDSYVTLKLASFPSPPSFSPVSAPLLRPLSTNLASSSEATVSTLLAAYNQCFVTSLRPLARCASCLKLLAETRHYPAHLTSPLCYCSAFPSAHWPVKVRTMILADLFSSVIHSASCSQLPQPAKSSRSALARHFGHFRSRSSVAATATASAPSSPSSPHLRLPLKSPSTSHLPSASAASAAPLASPISTLVLATGEDMTTLPDPRKLSNPPTRQRSFSSRDRHPDLDHEVAMLSTKLIKAINQQAVLDDTLTATRLDLQAARERVQELELQNQSQRDMMAGDVWVRRSTLDAERKTWTTDKKALQAQLADETTRRLDTDKEKRRIEQELENLTTALFEEANKMVIAAKEEAQAQHDLLRRKNAQLAAQLADSQSLLQTQQEQLAELKLVMEGMASENGDGANSGLLPSSPRDPRFGASDEEHTGPENPNIKDSSDISDDVPPSNPTSLHQLVRPVLRYDLPAYEDFLALARLSHHRRGNRVSSGSITGGLGALALGLGAAVSSSAHPSNASTASLNTSSHPVAGSGPPSPSTPANPASTTAPSTPAGTRPPSLKETKFYKRALAEDIEPAMRLDTAPGLSWLARRSVLAAMTDGSLVVEPFAPSSTNPPSARSSLHACALCGDHRAERPRSHYFRISEADSAQRYPLCDYCLARLRFTCDFLGFLRMVKDGHWKASDEGDERTAWEESVKLREQIFWARIGGGVVPAGQPAAHPPVSACRAGETGEALPSQESAHAAASADAAAKGTSEAVSDAEQDDGRRLSKDSEYYETAPSSQQPPTGAGGKWQPRLSTEQQLSRQPAEGCTLTQPPHPNTDLPKSAQATT